MTTDHPHSDTAPAEFPRIVQTVIDATDVRRLAEFYRQMFGLRYRPGDEPPTDGEDDDADWLVLVDGRGMRQLAFQQADELPRSTWPEATVPQQLHLDCSVVSLDELQRQRSRAEELGASLVFDRTDDEDEPLYVMADPAGHPFCLFVA